MISKETKTCRKCTKDLPLYEFNLNKDSKDGLRNSCRSCDRLYRQGKKHQISEKRKEYRRKNKEYIKKYNEEYYNLNKEKIKAYKKQWREANKESRDAYDKNYRKYNSEKTLSRARLYQANKTDSVPDFLRESHLEKKRLLQVYKLRSLITQATGIEHHVDHIWPLSKGGPHWSGNLQIITAKDNLSKHTDVSLETIEYIKESLLEEKYLTGPAGMLTYDVETDMVTEQTGPKEPTTPDREDF